VVFLFFFTISLKAQEKIISGIITDAGTKQPVEFATVQLEQADSILNSTVTDRKGKFSLQTSAEGSVVLQMSFIGYNKLSKPLTITSIQRNVNIGSIEISLSKENLQEVTVTGRRSLLNTSIDRKVYNVSSDVMAQSGSASDILKNIPSVEVDIEGTVSLRGSTGVMILINGRPSPLMRSSMAEALEQLPANSIEKIEVITNPSARFKPDGTSGIINIVLKKNLRSGFNGTATVTAGSNDRYGTNLSLNYKPQKLNLYSNYSFRHDKRKRMSTVERVNYNNGNISSYYSENNQSNALPVSHLGSLGFDYTVNEQNSFGASANHVNRQQDRNNIGQRIFYNLNKQKVEDFDRLLNGTESEVETDGTLYFQHNFSKEDQELRLELTASKDQEVEDNRFKNQYRFPLLPTTLDNTLIKQGDKQQQFTIDYTDPLTEESNVESGYDGTFTQQDLNFYGEYFDAAQGKFVKDVIKTNRFLYNEAIHAIYTTYQHGYEKFSYSAGLRAEAAIIKGNLVTKDSIINNEYFKLYPTIHLAYKLNTGEFQLNYSKRVNRPDGDELNPFPEYQDPRNLRAGNPKLLPEIIHSAEFGYQWRNDDFSFVPSLYYRYKKNGFTDVVIKLNDTTLLSTIQNLSNDKSAGLELIFSAKAGKFLSANLSSNFFYNKIDASELGFSNQKSIVSMSSNINTVLTLTKTTMLQTTMNFRSARLTPQGKVYPNFVFNTGLRQELFNKKIVVTLTSSDLFKTLKQKTELNTSFLKQTVISRRDAQIFYLGISYRFGTAFKKTEEKLQFDNNLQ
jgi:outer membrane receptor protein involved in Fe transport